MSRKRVPSATRQKRRLWTAGILVVAIPVMIGLVTRLTQRAAARAYGPELTTLCAEVASAAELPGTVPDGKLLVLQGGGKRIHPWHRALPDERRADSAGEADYAACIRPSSHTVEVCRYTSGGRVKRIRYSYQVTFVDPELRAPVAFKEVYGSNPGGCPASKGQNFATVTIKGEQPRVEAFVSLLQAQAPVSQPTVAREEPIQDEPVRAEPTAVRPVERAMPTVAPVAPEPRRVEKARPTAVKLVPEPTRASVGEAKEPPQAVVTPGREPPESAELTGSPSLWSGPDHLGEHMGIILKQGERVEILATTETWTQVRWMSPEGNEVIGWALSEFVGRP